MAFLDYSGLSHFKEKIDSVIKQNNFYYAECSTAGDTAAKTATLTGYTLVSGQAVAVKFTYTNTAANPTLNINSTGAKPIYNGGSAVAANVLKAGYTYLFRYNGTQYDLLSASGEDISGKADKVTSATAGDVATLDANGNLVDSGKTLGKSVPSDAVFTDTTYESKSASSGGTDVSLVTTGEKYNWNNKADGPASSTADHVATFSDTTGKVIKDSGYTIATSVPSGAVFTDTTPTPLSLTATSSGWSNSSPYTQTISATGVTALNNVSVSPGICTSAQYDMMAEAKMQCTAQAAGSITLTCYGDKPTADLPIQVFILG